MRRFILILAILLMPVIVSQAIKAAHPTKAMLKELAKPEIEHIIDEVERLEDELLLKPRVLNYYPNPSTGRFTLHFVLEQAGEVTVKVRDILGKEVYRERLADFHDTYENNIDLRGRGKGIYILQIHQDKKLLSSKILIE